MNFANLRERTRFWFWQYANALGLIVAVAGILLLSVAGLLLTRTVGPSRTVVGVVNAVWLPPSKTALRPMADVQLPQDGVHSLRLVPGHSCKAGDLVAVVETPEVWGVDRQVSPLGCNR